MSDWGGFSEAELRHLRSGGDSSNNTSKSATAKNGPKKSLGARKTTKPTNTRKNNQKNQPPEAALLPTKPVEEKVEKEAINEIHATVKPEPVLPEVITEEEVDEKKKLDIADVNRVQKEMEEKNKRRRAALAQEVQCRQRKAALESKMLKTIEDELAKLDQLLNADVSVLRDQIDVASYEFNDARRRFDTAEKEYVEAKFDLQKKTETKETLTEHLVSLIQMNEERKQKKLEELTYKLSMDPEVIAEREAEAAKRLQEEEEAEKKRKAEEREKRLEEERLKAEEEKSKVAESTDGTDPVAAPENSDTHTQPDPVPDAPAEPKDGENETPTES